MAKLAERKQLRESRLRPWLVNSATSRVTKSSCNAERLDVPKVAKAAQMAPSPTSEDLPLFQEGLEKTLESLSLAARPSRIPRWMPKRSCQGRMRSVPGPSEDEEVVDPLRRYVDATLPVGGKQAGSTKIPFPRRLAEKVRGWLKACNRVVSTGSVGSEGSVGSGGRSEGDQNTLLGRLGVKTQKTMTDKALLPQRPSLKSCLKKGVAGSQKSPADCSRGKGVKPRPSALSNRPAFRVFGNGVKPKALAGKKVRFLATLEVYDLPGHKEETEAAPVCELHKSCSEGGEFTCLEEKDEDGDILDRPVKEWYVHWEDNPMGCDMYPGKSTSWFEDQLRRGNNYFLECGSSAPGYYFKDDELSNKPDEDYCFDRADLILALETF